MKLTRRILEAIVTMAGVVEAGSPDDYLGYDNAETRKQYHAAIDAGIWARQQIRLRQDRKAKE